MIGYVRLTLDSNPIYIAALGSPSTVTGVDGFKLSMTGDAMVLDVAGPKGTGKLSRGCERARGRLPIAASNKVLNDCYDSQPRRYLVSDNIFQGALPSATGTICISDYFPDDPMFTNATNADFHTGNAAVATYGAYAP